jgi:hypothetical protein
VTTSNWTPEQGEPKQTDFEGDFRAFAQARLAYGKYVAEQAAAAPAGETVETAAAEAPLVVPPPVAPPATVIAVKPAGDPLAALQQNDEPGMGYAVDPDIEDRSVEVEANEYHEAFVQGDDGEYGADVVDEQAVHELQQEAAAAAAETEKPKPKRTRAPRELPEADELDAVLASFAKPDPEVDAVTLWRREQKRELSARAGGIAQLLATLAVTPEQRALVLTASKTAQRLVAQGEKVIDTLHEDQVQRILGS